MQKRRPLRHGPNLLKGASPSASACGLHSELSSSCIQTRSRKDQARDGQMSAVIRPLLDICPDRIRLKQSPGPHVHARVAHWCAGVCVRLLATRTAWRTEEDNGTPDDLCDQMQHVNTHGGAVHFLAQQVTTAPNLFAIWLICHRRFFTQLLQMTWKEKW